MWLKLDEGKDIFLKGNGKIDAGEIMLGFKEEERKVISSINW